MTACYFVVSSEDFTAYLQRAADGESPDMLTLEFYANADGERVE